MASALPVVAAVRKAAEVAVKVVAAKVDVAKVVVAVAPAKTGLRTDVLNRSLPLVPVSINLPLR